MFLVGYYSIYLDLFFSARFVEPSTSCSPVLSVQKCISPRCVCLSLSAHRVGRIVADARLDRLGP